MTERGAILVQRELIKVSRSDPREWIARYAERFRLEVEANPEFADLVRRDPAAAQRQLEKLLG